VYQDGKGGSGTWIGYNPETKIALVISAAHIFDAYGEVKVTTQEGKEHGGLVLVLDRENDIAVLEVKVPYKPDCSILADIEPQPDADVWKCGFPVYYDEGNTVCVRYGTVRTVSGGFTAKVTVRSGDSGGGVFNKDGLLVSVVSGFLTNEPAVMIGAKLTDLHAAIERVGWEECCIFKRHKKKKGGGSPGGPPPKQGSMPTPPKQPQMPDTPPAAPNTASPPATVPPAKDGLNGKDGANGKDGKDGKDADPDAIAAAVLKQFLPVLDAREQKLQVQIDAIRRQVEQLSITVTTLEPIK